MTPYYKFRASILFDEEGASGNSEEGNTFDKSRHNNHVGHDLTGCFRLACDSSMAELPILPIPKPAPIVARPAPSAIPSCAKPVEAASKRGNIIVVIII